MGVLLEDLPMWATQWQVRGHLFIFTKPIASMSMGLTYYDVKANTYAGHYHYKNMKVGFRALQRFQSD
jgi:hypothetical protein